MIHTLEADSILLEIGARKILSDIYLKCETGKITGLLGRNGQGKSCLMNVLFGNLKARHKSIRLDTQPIKNIDSSILTYLPQANFIPKSSTIKQVFYFFNLDFDHFTDRFPDFKMKFDFKFLNLSTGQRRLVEIYALIMCRSKFTLLDEPFSNLSPITVELVKDLIITEKSNKGFLITDHLYAHIIEISDAIYLLAEGKTRLVSDLDEMKSLGYING